jgi:hypothetical protein
LRSNGAIGATAPRRVAYADASATVPYTSVGANGRSSARDSSRLTRSTVINTSLG